MLNFYGNSISLQNTLGGAFFQKCTYVMESQLFFQKDITSESRSAAGPGPCAGRQRRDRLGGGENCSQESTPAGRGRTAERAESGAGQPRAGVRGSVRRPVRGEGRDGTGRGRRGPTAERM